MRQPAGSIIQTAFVVRDLERSAVEYSRAMGIGPFFRLDHVPMANADYRGRSVSPDFSVAVGFTGAMQIELIQQHCDTPSVYREVLDTHGEGYHHVCRRVDDFDAGIADYRAMGFEVAFRGDCVGLGRCVYLDTHGRCGPFVELLEMTPVFVAGWEAMERTTAEWDGRTLFAEMPEAGALASPFGG